MKNDNNKNAVSRSPALTCSACRGNHATENCSLAGELPTGHKILELLEPIYDDEIHEMFMGLTADQSDPSPD